MKKLLTLLSLLTISSSAATMVVSCGNSPSVQKANLDFSDIDDSLLKNIYNGITKIDGLFDDGIDYSSEMTYESFKTSYSSLIQQMINSKLYNKNEAKIDKNISSNIFGSSNEVSSDEDKSLSKLEELTSSSLYNSFTASIAANDNGSSLWTFEKTALTDGGALNAFADITNAEGKTETLEFKAYVKTSSMGDNDDFEEWTVMKDLNNGLFTNVSDFQSAQFEFKATGSDKKTYYLGSDGEVTEDNKEYIFNKTSDENTTTVNTSELKTVLSLRYQLYVKYTLMTDDIYDDTLASSYLRQNLFTTKNITSSANGMGLFLNRNSAVSKYIQSWGNYQEDFANYKANTMLIWGYEYDSAYDKDVNDALNTFIKDNGGSQDLNAGVSIKNAITAVDDAIAKSSNKVADSTEDGNLSINGSDSWFGIKGFQGIGKVDSGSITAVSGTLDSTVTSSTKLAYAKNEFILKNSDSSFVAPNNSNHRIIYFAVPIYSMDIFGSTSNEVAATKTDTTTYNISISSTGLTPLKSVVGSLDSDDTLIKTINGVKYIDGEELAKSDVGLTIEDTTAGIKYIIKSSDSQYTVQETIKDDNGNDVIVNENVKLSPYAKTAEKYAADMKKWVTKTDDYTPHYSKSITDLSANAKASLLSELESLTISNDSTIVTSAKTSIYSAYITSDDVYWTSLLSDISKYISEESSSKDSD